MSSRVFKADKFIFRNDKTQERKDHTIDFITYSPIKFYNDLYIRSFYLNNKTWKITASDTELSIKKLNPSTLNYETKFTIQ